MTAHSTNLHCRDNAAGPKVLLTSCDSEGDGACKRSELSNGMGSGAGGMVAGMISAGTPGVSIGGTVVSTRGTVVADGALRSVVRRAS